MVHFAICMPNKQGTGIVGGEKKGPQQPILLGFSVTHGRKKTKSKTGAERENGGALV